MIAATMLFKSPVIALSSLSSLGRHLKPLFAETPVTAFMSSFDPSAPNLALWEDVKRLGAVGHIDLNRSTEELAPFIQALRERAKRSAALRLVLARYFPIVKIQPPTDFAALTGRADDGEPAPETPRRLLRPIAPRAPSSERLA